MKMMDKNTISVVLVLCFAAVASFIGEEPIFEGSTQAWIGALIGAAVSIGSSLIASSQANKAAKQQQAANAQAWSEYQKWYEDQIGTNILDKADTLSMLKRYRDWQEENAKKFQNSAIKGGASEEAKVAYAQQANKGYADAISRIAGMAQQYKDRLSQSFAQNKFNFQLGQAEAAAQGSQAAANAISGAGSSIADLVGGIDWGTSEHD